METRLLGAESLRVREGTKASERPAWWQCKETATPVWEEYDSVKEEKAEDRE
jgi:hypothetical protein